RPRPEGPPLPRKRKKPRRRRKRKRRKRRKRRKPRRHRDRGRQRSAKEKRPLPKNGERLQNRGLNPKPHARRARSVKFRSQGFALMPRDSQLKSPIKAVGTHHYVHLEGFQLLPTDATARLVAAESLAQITRGDRYNVARFDNSHNRVALLNYP